MEKDNPGRKQITVVFQLEEAKEMAEAADFVFCETALAILKCGHIPKNAGEHLEKVFIMRETLNNQRKTAEK